jgi:chromosome segregation ATPase
MLRKTTPAKTKYKDLFPSEERHHIPNFDGAHNSANDRLEEATEKIVVQERTILHLLEVHTWILEVQSAAESKNQEIEAQHREALETITQKEPEVKALSEKLDTLEIELGYYNQQATEAAATDENHNVKYDKAAQKIKGLEEFMEIQISQVGLVGCTEEDAGSNYGLLKKPPAWPNGDAQRLRDKPSFKRRECQYL